MNSLSLPLRLFFAVFYRRTLPVASQNILFLPYLRPLRRHGNRIA